MHSAGGSAAVKLPSPGTTLAASSVLAGCAWLVLDLVVRDPWTVLFIAIALGSDLLVRTAAGGVFADANPLVTGGVRMLTCVALFAGPGAALRWSSAKRFTPAVTSWLLVGWLVFYLAALAFLFPPGRP